MLFTLLTGLAAGAFHVVGGADHIVSMAPVVLSKPRKAINSGLAWGLGHSTGIIVLMVVAIVFNDIASIEQLSSFAEFSVGLSLLVLGVLAIRSSVRLKVHSHQHFHSQAKSHDHIHVHLLSKDTHLHHVHASTSLGLLHGVAGASHIIAVLPVLALPPSGAVLYLLSYLLGSILAMGGLVLSISLAIVKTSGSSLALILRTTGIFSVSTGLFWIHKCSTIVL